MYIDCHAHVFFSPIPKEAIDDDIIGDIPTPTIEFITKMISDAKKKGVSHIVGAISNPNDLQNYKKQLELENIIHVLGISRNHASKNQTELIALLQKEIERKTPHAIGEIGLDYSYGFENIAEEEKDILVKNQQELFRKQIRIAKELNIPIVVHAGYKDDKDIVKIIKQERAQDVGGQIHGYMTKKELILELLDMGFYFSIGYMHLINDKLKEIIDITPMKQLLAETDSPYHLMVSPKKFIYPEDIVFVTNEIAKLKEMNIKTLTNQVMENARKLFRF
ncbi:MAG: TatD family deoxyribonuclease [Asgard group archaeon]|nr:TatD family deoxyribonuclease [Asgard group archaeon]